MTMKGAEGDPASSGGLIDQWLAMPYAVALALSALIWALVLGLIWAAPCMSLRFKKEGADRVSSTLHAIVTAILGVLVQTMTAPSCSTEGSLVRAPMLVLLGYLVVDLVSMLFVDVFNGWRPVDLSAVFHHVFIITFFSLGYTHDVGVWWGSALLINEFSTPFVNFLWYLTFTEQKQKPIFLYNGIALLVVFTLCRIVFIPFSFYQLAAAGFCLSSGNEVYRWASWVMGFGYAVLMAMNLVWWQKMARGAKKKLCGSSEKDPSSDSATPIDQQLAANAGLLSETSPR